MARHSFNKVVLFGSLFSCSLLTAVVFIISAVVLWLVSPSLLRAQVNKEATIQEGHAIYEQLQDPSLPAWRSLYFFNLTNPEDFEEKGSKPILQEVGPYSYREYRKKQFIEFSPDQQFLKYNQTKVFYFDRDATDSRLSESDTICTINIPLIAAADRLAGVPANMAFLENLMQQLGTHLYVCQNASALAWNYTDSFIQTLHAFQQYPLTYVAIQVNNSINDSRPSIIRTGVDNIDLIGQFIQWDGHEGRLNTWRPLNSTCNMLNGTEGLFFRPNLKEGDNLQAFVDDIQRSVDLVYVGKVNNLGVEAFRYKLADHTFLNVSQYPDNACWGPYKPAGVKTPQGLFYLGPTHSPEFPVFASYPHFYGGDPSLQDCVEGLEPTIDKIAKFDVEPISGAGIQFQKNVQLNIEVTKYDIMYLKNVQCVDMDKSFYYPVLWLSEHAELTPEFKEYLEEKGLKNVRMFNIVVKITVGLLLVLAVVMVCISFCVCFYFCRLPRTIYTEEAKNPLVNSKKHVL